MSDTAHPEILSDFYHEDELAAQLGRHPRTLARWRRQRRGPRFSMMGREPLYHKDDAAEWLRKGGIANGDVNKKGKHKR